MCGESRSHGSYLLLNALGPPQSCKAIREASWSTMPFDDSFRCNMKMQIWSLRSVHHNVAPYHVILAAFRPPQTIPLPHRQRYNPDNQEYHTNGYHRHQSDRQISCWFNWLFRFAILYLGFFSLFLCDEVILHSIYFGKFWRKRGYGYKMSFLHFWISSCLWGAARDFSWRLSAGKGRGVIGDVRRRIIGDVRWRAIIVIGGGERVEESRSVWERSATGTIGFVGT